MEYIDCLFLHLIILDKQIIMPYEKYKISMRDHNFKTPKTTLKRERESYRKKLILVDIDANVMDICKERKFHNDV
jgi:hypothetical protein